MTEAIRHDTMLRRQTGMSDRATAKEFGVLRGAVPLALTRVEVQRDAAMIRGVDASRREACKKARQTVEEPTFSFLCFIE